jgi:hypothetical protein
MKNEQYVTLKEIANLKNMDGSTWSEVMKRLKFKGLDNKWCDNLFRITPDDNGHPRLVCCHRTGEVLFKLRYWKYVNDNIANQSHFKIFNNLPKTHSNYKLQPEDCSYDRISYFFDIVDYNTIISKNDRGTKANAKAGIKYPRADPDTNQLTKIGYKGSSIQFDRLFSALFRKEAYPKRTSYRSVDIGEYNRSKIVDRPMIVEEYETESIISHKDGPSYIQKLLDLSQSDLLSLTNLSRDRRDLILQLI